MTDREDPAGFLGRWSRRKQEARRAEMRPQQEAQAPVPPAAPPGSPAVEEPEIDLSSLPPLESLGPDSDFSVFLRKGVPAALRNAALRKAWTSDPVISTFREVADYDWDFNAPGYGQLLPTDDVEKLLRNLFSREEPSSSAAVETSAPESRVSETGTEEGEGPTERAEPPQSIASPAPQEERTAPSARLPEPQDHLRLPEREAAGLPIRGSVDTGKSRNPPCESGENGVRGVSDRGETVELPVPRRRRHGGAAPR